MDHCFTCLEANIKKKVTSVFTFVTAIEIIEIKTLTFPLRVKVELQMPCFVLEIVRGSAVLKLKDV